MTILLFLVVLFSTMTLGVPIAFALMLRISANVTGHFGDRDRRAEGGFQRRFGIVTARFGDHDRRDVGGAAQGFEFTVEGVGSGLHVAPVGSFFDAFAARAVRPVRRDSPSRLKRRQLCSNRSRMASATVGSPSQACQCSMGS